MPDFNLAILFLWVKVISIKKTNSSIDSLSPVKIKLNNKIKSDDINEANEAYFVKKIITIHRNVNTIASQIFIANNIPKYVATPFPPLNLSHIGNKCPKKTTKADKVK